MKLRSRIHLYSTVLFAVLLSAANLTVYYIFSEMTMNRELNQMTAETVQAAREIRQTSNQLAVKELLRAYVPLSGMIRVVEEADGTGPVVTSPDSTDLSRFAVDYSSQRQSEQVLLDGKHYGFVSIPVIGAGGDVVNIQAVQSLEDLRQQLRMLRIVLLFVSVAVMIPVFISGGVLGSIIMRPISALTKTMREIASSGKFMRIRQEGSSKDELASMGETFNEMIGLLENHFTKQQQFVQSASHELKTPLTIIASYASLLKRRGMDRPELFLESVEAIHSEAIRMQDLTEQLLLLAKPDEQWRLDFKQVDLAPLAEQVAEGIRRAFGRELAVELPGRTPIYAYTDADKLKQLLFILLDNARKYSSDPIRIIMDREGKLARIQIVDKGIGIPEEDLPFVFDRFYRVDKARSRGQEPTGGSGLGLSLAREIADAIGARLTLTSVEGQGTTAWIVLPEDRTHDSSQ